MRTYLLNTLNFFTIKIVLRMAQHTLQTIHHVLASRIFYIQINSILVIWRKNVLQKHKKHFVIKKIMALLELLMVKSGFIRDHYTTKVQGRMIEKII